MSPEVWSAALRQMARRLKERREREDAKARWMFWRRSKDIVPAHFPFKSDELLAAFAVWGEKGDDEFVSQAYDTFVVSMKMAYPELFDQKRMEYGRHKQVTFIHPDVMLAVFEKSIMPYLKIDSEY